MKKIAILITALIIVFSLFSFTLAEVNPFVWQKEQRFGMSLAFVVVIWIWCGVYLDKDK